MKRTFIAIKINAGVKLLNLLSYFKQALQQEKIKWVDPVIMHITITFLGDTDEKIVPSVSEIINNTALVNPPFEMIFRGTGIFKNLRDPRVIWIGTEINPKMQNLKASLDTELSKFGFEKESREFRPHLTLGRIKWIKDRSALQEALEQFQDQEVQKELITELIYYESILKPEGPQYLPILKAPLSGRNE